jgi:hypothetical protein
MKYKSVAVLMVFISCGLAWGQFYRDYSEVERQLLADAYFQAGAQYLSVGKTDLGKQYQRLAYQIYPAYKPGQIVEVAHPSAAQLLAQGTAKPLTPEAVEVKLETAPQSFFLRFIGAFLDEDPAEILPFLDGSVWLDSQGGEISRQDIRAALQSFFSTTSLAGIEPGELYDLGSAVIVAAPDAAQKQWGPTSILRVDAKMDFSGQLSFWEPTQQFFVHKRTDGWRIFAIGQNPPPQGWTPQAPPPVAAAPTPAAATISRIDKDIADSFTACVSAFLAKNAEGARAYFTTDVQILRIHQTISAEELLTTFEGYFETSDFGGTIPSDIVDTAGMFVTPTKEFAETVPGAVYTLNVKAKTDLSDKIPFWTTYQRYYFVEEDGAWKIFAIF